MKAHTTLVGCRINLKRWPNVLAVTATSYQSVRLTPAFLKLLGCALPSVYPRISRLWYLPNDGGRVDPRGGQTLASVSTGKMNEGQ